jgi:hypothetical protein
VKLLALAFLFALSSAIHAHEVKVGNLVIVHPMVEPSIARLDERRGM